MYSIRMILRLVSNAIYGVLKVRVICLMICGHAVVRLIKKGFCLIKEVVDLSPLVSHWEW